MHNKTLQPTPHYQPTVTKKVDEVVKEVVVEEKKVVEPVKAVVLTKKDQKSHDVEVLDHKDKEEK